MFLVLFLQIFSDSIRSNNSNYDQLVNKIYSLNLKSYRISDDSLEKIKLNSMVKGYKFRAYKFENVVETFKSATMDGKITIEQSDPKDVEIYEFYDGNKTLFYIIKEVYNGLNKRVYVNLYHQ